MATPTASNPLGIEFEQCDLEGRGLSWAHHLFDRAALFHHLSTDLEEFRAPVGGALSLDDESRGSRWWVQDDTDPPIETHELHPVLAESAAEGWSGWWEQVNPYRMAMEAHAHLRPVQLWLDTHHPHLAECFRRDWQAVIDALRWRERESPWRDPAVCESYAMCRKQGGGWYEWAMDDARARIDQWVHETQWLLDGLADRLEATGELLLREIAEDDSPQGRAARAEMAERRIAVDEADAAEDAAVEAQAKPKARPRESEKTDRAYRVMVELLEAGELPRTQRQAWGKLKDGGHEVSWWVVQRAARRRRLADHFGIPEEKRDAAERERYEHDERARAALYQEACKRLERLYPRDSEAAREALERQMRRDPERAAEVMRTLVSPQAGMGGVASLEELREGRHGGDGDDADNDGRQVDLDSQFKLVEPID